MVSRPARRNVRGDFQGNINVVFVLLFVLVTPKISRKKYLPGRPLDRR